MLEIPYDDDYKNTFDEFDELLNQKIIRNTLYQNIMSETK